MTTLSIIVAIDNNNAIGKDNQMLAHLPLDLKYFQKVTSGHSVVMGRKTFESLPKGALPNRRNIVITQNTSLAFANCEMAHSIEDAVKLTAGEDEVFIMGGGIIYDKTMSLAHKLYITHIHHAFEQAEVYFPEINLNIWKETWREEHLADERHKYDFSFVRYEKIIP